MKTKDLIGPALDWAVAKCRGVQTHRQADKLWIVGQMYTPDGEWSPSTDWAQGGPIIEREEITIKHIIPATRDSIWQAHPSMSAKGAGGKWGIGPTPLIAAMRCYVASKLGESVDVPEELK
jgi:hypothetical protein